MSLGFVRIQSGPRSKHSRGGPSGVREEVPQFGDRGGIESAIGKFAYPFWEAAGIDGLGMEDAFLQLHLARTLDLSEEQLRRALRAVGAEDHPDSGGAGNDFESARSAFLLLSSPSQRLRHWLELSGHEPEARGVIGPDLMECFGRVSEIGSRAEKLAKNRESTQSALGLALLEGETQRIREELEEMIAEIDRAMADCCGLFADFQDGKNLDQAPRVMRSLGFLEKWRGGLRTLYARLI